MNATRPLAALLAIAMIASVFAGSAAAVVAPTPQQDCDDLTVMQGQSSDDINALNVNADTNVNALNTNANVPIASPDSDYNGGDQTIGDSNDDFQSDDQVQSVC